MLHHIVLLLKGRTLSWWSLQFVAQQNLWARVSSRPRLKAFDVGRLQTIRCLSFSQTLSDVSGSPRHKMPLLVTPFISVQSGVLVLPFVSQPSLQVETRSCDSAPITVKLFDVLPGHILCVGAIYMLYTINRPHRSSVNGIYCVSILFVI